MKNILIILMLLTVGAHGGWFDGREKEQQQRIQQYEQELTTERKKADSWQIVASVLGIGAVVLFTVGTALGSTIRHRHEESQ